MLATRLRTRPCRARWRKSSEGRSKTSSPSTCLTVMSAGKVRSSWPFGPSTLTWPGCKVTFTVPGNGIGTFQIRDTSFLRLLPDVCQHFAAEAVAGRLAPGHDSFGCAENGDAEPTEDSRDLCLARVDAQAGAADPLHARDHASAIGASLEDDTHRLSGSVGFDLVAGDVALVLQDARDLELQLGSRNLHLGMSRGVGVAHACEHVRDRVAYDAGGSAPHGFRVFRDCCIHHQLDFVTPGMRPSAARLRKQMRHMPNFR